MHKQTVITMSKSDWENNQYGNLNLLNYYGLGVTKEFLDGYFTTHDKKEFFVPDIKTYDNYFGNNKDASEFVDKILAPNIKTINQNEVKQFGVESVVELKYMISKYVSPEAFELLDITDGKTPNTYTISISTLR